MHILKTTLLYGNLYYQTPGALTLSEYTASPRMSRPAGGGFPGAIENKAAITQRSFVAGISYEQIFSLKWHNKTTVYGMFTELRNPTIRNYSKSSEPHTGGRTIFSFHQPWEGGSFKWDIGAEYQQSFNSVMVSKNKGGNADSLQTYDEVYTTQKFAFTQASLTVSDWMLTAGASGNIRKIDFQRFQPYTIGKQERKFKNEIAPRVSISRKISDITLYADLSKGFSPPTSDELSPSGGAFNPGLNAEEGVNYEVGAKAAFHSGLYLDINAFKFSLNNMIVQRRDAGGGDYYINAGNTRQFGIETYISYPFLQQLAIFRRSLFWLSHTWHDFHYNNFKPVAGDFSGKQLPAEPPHTVSTGFDFIGDNGWNWTIAYYYNAKIPLNDANTAYANAYNLVSLKLGYQMMIKTGLRLKLLAGVENLLDQKYSLGNDINGFGGRYYNAAPGRNYYASFIIQWNTKKD
jgi:iron complex outermembrane receptor protein